MSDIVLTDAVVKAAKVPEGKNEIYLREVERLALRVRASGSKTFVFFSTRPGMKGSHKITIGKPSRHFKVADARKRAKVLAGQHAQGVDLIAARREQKATARRAAKAAAVTVGALLVEGGEYEKSLLARNYRKPKQALSVLRRNLLPDHGSTNIRDLTRQDITGAMDKLTDGAASDLRKHVSTFLAWATDTKGYADHNVMTGYRRPKETRAERLGRQSKGRALTDEEIVKVWPACGKLGAFGLLARMCLLGGPRRSEPTFIEWSKHVMDDRITFDAHWTKMGLHHDIPRTALVDAVLEDAKSFRRASSDLVFPSSLTGGRLTAFTKPLRRLIAEAGTDKFMMHDLRRTLRTIMSKCGFDNDIQRLCVGQKPRGIDQVYNMDEQWIIRKMAFEAAHAYIAALVQAKRTDNVVRLARANNPQNKLKAELLERLREHHAREAAG